MAQSKTNYDFKFDNFDGTNEEWIYWYERLKIAFRNNSIKQDDKKRDILMGKLGPHPFKLVFDHARPTPVTHLGFEDVVEILQKYYVKPAAPLSQRVTFTRRFRHEGESLNQYELALRTLAGQCQFGTNMNERLRDQLILGINNDKWQLELLRLHASTDTTLTDVIKSASLLENVDTQQTEIREPLGLNRVEPYNNKVSKKTQQNTDNNTVKRLDGKTQCLRCGNLKHDPGKRCPASGVECRACGGLNHFYKVCLKVGNATVSRGKNINNIKKSTSSSNASIVSYSDIDNIQNIKKGSKVMILVQINNTKVSMLYDPGAVSSIIGEELWKQIGSPKLSPTEPLSAYTGVPIETLGTTSVTVKAFKTSRKLNLVVVKKNDIPLFGLDWVIDFRLPLPPGAKICTINTEIPKTTDTTDNISNAILKEFSEVFEPSLGTIKNCSVTFHMSPDAEPIVSKPRPVPFALKKSVEDELNRLVENGVLKPVNANEEPIIWASPVVLVVKPTGAVRICADFKNTINKFMLADKYPMPRFEEITSKLTGGNEFSTIDLKDAYLQMEVHPSVQHFLVISTHKGFFKYSRLPFGIKIASGSFQKKMDQVLAGLEGVACLLDDVIITAPTRKKHIELVREVLRRFTESGIRVQYSKCKWFQKSVSYLGHQIDSKGIHPTEEHIQCLKNLPSPKSIRELRSFLGSMNYFGKFIPHLQSICSPLHKLLQKGEKWLWTQGHEDIVCKLRTTLSASNVLTHYNEVLPLILATDASDVGLGVALFHRFQDGTEKPIAFASRRLSLAETKYSIIEKEALGLVFGVKRFEQYLYGRHFEIRTDHKALTKLFGEHDQIPKVVSNRIARWALMLSAYDYSITYLNGKDNNTADFLSRFPHKSEENVSPEERLGRINRSHLFHLRIEDLHVSTKKLRETTKHDSTLCKVITYTKTSWPSDKDIGTDLLPYYRKREELSFENGVLLWLGRLVIPSQLRNNILDLLHEGHPGIVAMKAKARFQVWWPKLDTDIEHFLKTCTGCQESRQKDVEVPLFSWTLPSETWSRIHIDFAGPFLGKMWLVVVDARSKWLEVIPTHGTTTQTTIHHLQELFSRYGYPHVIVSDNGPQLTSFEFKTFCDNLNIKHARISPYHPKTNGLAERCVKTFKKRMTATKSDKGTIEQKLEAFLFSYRTTPKRSTGRTPAYMMFGRELRSKIDLLMPTVEAINDQELLQQLNNKPRGKVKYFSKEEDVWVLNTTGCGYKKGQIIKENGPYSYDVEVNGKTRRCHADQLRAAAHIRFRQGKKM